MAQQLLDLLSSLSATTFRIAAIGFVLVNGAALVAFVLTRSRSLVDRWTPRLVTLDAVLLGAGLGVPLLAGFARVGVRLVAGALGLTLPK